MQTTCPIVPFDFSRHLLRVLALLRGIAGRPGPGRGALAALAAAVGVLAPALPASAQITASLTTIHQFSAPNPAGGVVLGTDGNFYGVTGGGGDRGFGSVYQIAPDNTFTTLHSFTGADGSAPLAALTQGTDGNFYGLTTAGGANGVGTIFKVTPTGTLTTLHSFAATEGGATTSALIVGLDGNFYGTTPGGGTNSAGTIFEITPAGVYSILYSFMGAADGYTPQGRLYQDAQGNFYGTAASGGTNGEGTVFEFAAGVLTPLYSFNYSDGNSPQGGVTLGTDGNLYGTTSSGGTFGYGTVFQLAPGGTLVTLVNFEYSAYGATPKSALTLGNDGYFYGTASVGGANGGGTAFQITPAGAFQTLHAFADTDGGNPQSALIDGGDGNFYGTTADGSVAGQGKVYQVDPAGDFAIIHNFTNSDGFHPVGKLVRGSDGYFRGTASTGGDYGDGTIFTVFQGNIVTLHSFNGDDGADPEGGLIFYNGVFYGTTRSGGSHSAGTIFSLDLQGTFTTLYNFAGTDGSGPGGELVRGTDGNFYGTTSGGGANGDGTVFQYTPAGGLMTLYSFADGTDGETPQGTLIQGSDGNLYGTTTNGPGNVYGTVFQISTNGMTFNTLYGFTYSDGGSPAGGVIQGADGNFYGTTSSGGSNGYGTVYRLTSGGALATLYNFDYTNGYTPSAALIQGSDGYFYGSTSGGGANGDGVLFRITSAGTLTTIHSFTGSDGSSPQATLAQDSDGRFYGTTASGGAGHGTVFTFSFVPVLTSATTLKVTSGKAFSYQIAGTNTPTIFAASGLPSGLSVNASSGVISGTTTAALGVYPVTLSLTNSYGTGTASVTLNLVDQLPAITSALSPAIQLGVAFTYQITASHNPTSYAATNLPPGLSLDPATGIISGTPTTAGNYSTIIKAINSGGTGSAVLSLSIKAPPPVLTSSTSAAGTVGIAFSYQIAATNNPTSYAATGLPSGLSVDTGTGIISGTPNAVATTSVTIKATNNGGTATATLTITVVDQVPVISGNMNSSGQQGVAYSYQIMASHNPTSYAASGLPTGLSVNAVTGAISGTPSVSGTFTIGLSATNSGGTGTATLNLTIIVAAPVFGNNLSTTGQVGVAFSYQIAASNNPTSYGASGLPTGLSVNPSTGVITGTPPTAGSFSATITATNGGGTTSAVLGLTIYPATPVITSAATATGQLTMPFSYQITASNAPASYAATGLPAGLSVNANTGLINGTPTALGTSTVTIKAINTGGTGTATLTITVVDQVPVVTSGTSATGQVGTAFSYQITASHSPTGYAATGLPDGLSVNTSTGLISGTPTTVGTSSVTVSATNTGGTASITLSLVINPATPVVSSATSATGQVGVPFSYQVTASNAPTSYAATGLPAGLSIAPTTGAITGTPSSPGTSSVMLSATNAGGTGTATLSLVINPATPVITSSLNATGQVGVPFNYQVTASNTPTGYAATGLPAGLSIAPGTGAITGTPTTTGTLSVMLSATNAGGTGTATLNLVINPATPVINGTLSVSGQVGVFLSYQITATNNPTSYAATGLPDGLSLNMTTGVISGTPTTAASSSFTISATNAGGTGMATLTFNINPATPVISSASSATGKVGVMFTYQITASNGPTSYAATGLPAGLSLDPGTGIISGKPTAAGTSSVTIKAINAGGTGTATLSLVIKPATPVVTSVKTASGQVGVMFTYQITATNNPTSYAATGLPAGLSLNTSTGAISGMPTAAGTSSVTIKAINSGGTGTATLSVVVKPAAPVITSGTTASGSEGVAFSYQITASNSPTSYAATGLPTGLSVNTSTGAISGTPMVAGTFSVTLSATNGGGTGTATLSVTIALSAPVITSALSENAKVGTPFTYQITARNSPASYAAAGLKSGLTLNTMTGVISGTPTAAGTLALTIRATNAAGSGTAKLTITIAAGPPTITSVKTAVGKVGTPFSYQIVASNSPTSYGAVGLKDGLKLNASTGVISGTPTATGTFSITIKATNASGSGTAMLAVTISAPPAIMSATTASGKVGTPFSYQIVASNTPTSYGAVGLKSGLAINAATGVISGTPTAAGTFNVTIKASNSAGTGTATLAVTIAK